MSCQSIFQQAEKVCDTFGLWKSEIGNRNPPLAPPKRGIFAGKNFFFEKMIWKFENSCIFAPP